jgi:23S rRNA (uracil1939-C5)-methyltransferase
MLNVGDTLSLAIDRPAVGGRMIARAGGQIVLVGGAIPGERVTARIERVGRGVVYAETLSPDEPSPDRRVPFTDLRCGGCLYAHIAYPRQLEIKALVVADAFARIARLELPVPIGVAASPEEGYRMRGRLHMRAGRVGFFREGTHDVCDARTTRQLLPETCDALDRLAAAVGSLRLHVREIELSENIDASERVVHLDAAGGAPDALEPLARPGSFTGLLAGTLGLAGSPYVTDTFRIAGRPIILRRHALAFFQGNRYLLRDLVGRVIGHVPVGGEVIDFYAGAGLFSIASAVVRGGRVTAVEGDRLAAADLEANAATADCGIAAVHQSVERFIPSERSTPDAVIVDPPRTGMSREALTNIIGLRAPRAIYVSCDVATLARDARRMTDSGYRIEHVEAFDLFPNTPHVETLVVFDR